MVWTAVVFVGVALGAFLAAPARGAEFRAGTGRVRITPDGPVWLAGYASRSKLSEGVAADLYARTLAVHDGTQWTVITAVDVIDFDPVLSGSIKELVRKRHGVPQERFLLVGSHTHSGPEVSTWGTSVLRDPDKDRRRREYADLLRRRIVESVGMALRSGSRAHLEFARGEARIGTYRRVQRGDGTWGFGADQAGPTDPDLPVLRVTGNDGRLLAVVFGHACHGTSITHGNEGFYLVHPDYARACSLLEDAHPGATVLFLTGCGGDIDPTVRGPLAAAERNAATMAASVDGVLRTATFRAVPPAPIVARLRRIRLPLENPDRSAFDRLAASGNADERAFASEKLREMDSGSLQTRVEYPVHVLGFGQALTMVCLAGETCVEYALRLKAELGPATTWVVGYANEVACYIPSDRVLRENGYESGWSLATGRGIATTQMMWAGFATPFAFGLEDRIVRAVRELVGDLAVSSEPRRPPSSWDP